MANPQVLNQLQTADRAVDIYAQLIDLNGTVAYNFLYNPESKRYSRNAQYGEAATGVTSVPAQNYLYTKGRTLELPDLLMESYAAGKSLRQLIEGLEQLLIADPATFTPKPVLFIWGTERFGPAVVTNIDWSETAWLGGEPAEARVSLSLLQIPEAETPTSTVAAPTGNVALTDRQRADARGQAGSWLNQNLTRLNPQVREAVQASRFRYLTNEQGEVTITDATGKPIGVAGVWDGFTWKPSSELLQ
ncbi:hypothetical protein [Pseudanabaena sp. FACHB-2040]|uniref:hypothetical protein n=1 Tax=Pseudanabaena sp. FACHB-2040 TaxID=2692859 RepID=UPI001687E7C3|nr:hypothetical protein [Pseudanabaena sp. FACHB-2040]MBD2256648.1 hypothetical protein [Pseudanabaena sp. FACHB-2040]